MVFSSVAFLFLFLPVVLLAYFAVPKTRNLLLLAASLLFYVWGGGAFVLILLVSVFVDYFFGWLAQVAVDAGSLWKKRLAVTGSVVINLSLLGYFKYANFVVDQLNAVGDRLGLGMIAWTSVALPIGISFFTFQSMSYTIDVASGAARHLRNPWDFALYVALFPQLVAGPIVRFHEIADQMEGRPVIWSSVAQGALRFGHGLTKKVLVADAVGAVADAAFGLDVGSLTFAAAWLGVAAYTVQIYFDFSGYSDMAIGLGMMFGFTFPENFERPYSAVSITDFWRRWHITLSNWFRDYVYIPLGGSRRGIGSTYFNLVFVFFITGLWHGANWTFVVWGLYHGMILIAERLLGLRGLEPGIQGVALRRAITLILVMVGWVLFRSNSISHAISYLSAMASINDGFTALPPLVAESFTNRAAVMLFIGSAVALLPRSFQGWRLPVYGESGRAALARSALVMALVPLSLITVASGSFSPFLYFQF